MKDFIKGLKFKKKDAGTIAGEIAYNQDALIDFYIKEAHRAKNADLKNELFTKMKHPKFLKALTKMIKAGKDDPDKGLSIGFTVIIAGLIEKWTPETEEEKEIHAKYCEIVKKLLKKRVKEVNKKLDLNPQIIEELLLIAPTVDYMSNDKFVGIYSQKMLRKLYAIAAKQDIGLSDTKQVKTLFKNLFRKDLLDLIAINILLEKKEYSKNFNDQQTALWNLMTTFACEFIEKEDKGHIYELVKYYCRRRHNDFKNNRDGARRINLGYVEAEQYPKFAKVIEKFKKKEKENVVKYL